MCVICKLRLAIRLTVMLCGRCSYIKTKLKPILALHVSRLASLWILRLDNLGKSCIRKLGESPSWYHHWLHSNKSLLPALTRCSAWNNGDPRGLYLQLKNCIHIFWSVLMKWTLNFAVIVAFCAAAGSALLAWYHPKHVLSSQAVQHEGLSDGLVALQKQGLYHALAGPYLAALSQNNNKCSNSHKITQDAPINWDRLIESEI